MSGIIPQSLLHYTTVENLELILKSKKIRFSSLSMVDDLEEQYTYDSYDHGKHIFVACFTDDEKESIPIWYMYSKGGQGVRLKFNGNLLDEFSSKYDDTVNKIIVASSGDVFPIEYTEDGNKLQLQLQKTIGGNAGLDITGLGKYKRTAWAFQNEWRYKLLAYRYIEENNQTLVDVRNIPISYYDVEVNKVVFNNLEVTLGYNINENNRGKVKSWIQEYNDKNDSNITIKESCFLHKIR